MAIKNATADPKLMSLALSFLLVSLFFGFNLVFTFIKIWIYTN